MKSADRYIHYQICLEGRLEERWLAWFEGLDVKSTAEGQTVISGELDQSALHGVFNCIRDLSLELVSVQRLVSDDEIRTRRRSTD
jgi:hypothetical protein